MKIETKFNIGDEVRIKNDKENRKAKIAKIAVRYMLEGNPNRYYVGELELVRENILTPEEKAYLEAVLRPFKDKVICINKISYQGLKQEYISINVDGDVVFLPNFEQGEYYKGMVLEKQYTLKELGLFEGEEQ